ncbi:hypothetical protein K505DRAFT_242738 [Melanomma pulvis-pyrius CBS 109.77]|uniref:Uncharacterized protein n=1 Tax=Melanomma pulvis-pyrius CBS 109.77 TaxID=1314802 RepID=A0A6A6XDH0_9PLEO|nr:hypothetical protein K505DRAFT_242738 [Melanomma pulvis-pyrius CBS 109.77]
MVDVSEVEDTQGLVLIPDEPLHTYLHRVFKPSKVLVGGVVRFKSDFIARNIHETAGIKISWTDNLANHLRLQRDGKVVHIFHHANFLKHRLHCLYFPDNLIQETLDTLSLLFPHSDGKTRALFDKQRSLFAEAGLDRKLVECGDLKAEDRNLNHFNFWRDRIEVLKDAFEESSPTRATLKVLRDRKNGGNWLNSWAAIVAIALTLFFGLVQSIEGAIQVYQLYHSKSEG